MPEGTVLKTEEFVEALALVKPALARRAFIPIHTKFKFGDGRVEAFNEVIGASALCPCGISGCVDGALMFDLVSSVKRSKVRITESDGSILVKGGKSRFELPIEDDSSAFNVRDAIVDPYAEIKVTEEVLQAISLCAISASSDTSTPQFMGITIIGDGESLKIYSTDFSSFSRASVNVDEHKEFRITVPIDFFSTMLSVAQKFGEDEDGVYGTLCISDISVDDPQNRDVIWFEIEDVEYFLYARTLSIKQPPNYEAVFRQHMNSLPKPVKIPKGLGGALDRVLILNRSLGFDRTLSELSVEDGVLKITAESGDNHVKDSFDLRDPDHPDVSVKIHPLLVNRVFDNCSEFCVGEKAILFRNSVDFIHFIATHVDTTGGEDEDDDS